MANFDFFMALLAFFFFLTIWIYKSIFSYLENFWPLLLNVFCSITALFYFWDSKYKYGVTLNIIPQVCEALLILLMFFLHLSGWLTSIVLSSRSLTHNSAIPSLKSFIIPFSELLLSVICFSHLEILLSCFHFVC